MEVEGWSLKGNSTKPSDCQGVSGSDLQNMYALAVPVLVYGEGSMFEFSLKQA